MENVNLNKMGHKQSLNIARSFLNNTDKKEFDLLLSKKKDDELVELLKRNDIEIVIYPDKNKTKGWSLLTSSVFHKGEIVDGIK